MGTNLSSFSNSGPNSRASSQSPGLSLMTAGSQYPRPQGSLQHQSHSKEPPNLSRGDSPQHRHPLSQGTTQTQDEVKEEGSDGKPETETKVPATNHPPEENNLKRNMMDRSVEAYWKKARMSEGPFGFGIGNHI